MPISPRYPLAELIVGLPFAGAYAARVAAPGGDVLEEPGAEVVLRGSWPT